MYGSRHFLGEVFFGRGIFRARNLWGRDLVCESFLGCRILGDFWGSEI